ncbi:GNAT family N-acetyltransferase [Rossellomorea vietnamensis]|uniref:GNAT family N-acetyltransferase n=1 Tax=Rossellomorea vietnamensis TaxID=218284 RepID=A0A5D4NY35_9BACI|nr:GNAT family N-acetyltransferase [Rossellomorea vietnamensis]TYS18779.1 GNAT family N-acetyltransferase [Rossellomorea vietnamensis]
MLTNNRLNEIEELQHLCEEHDNCKLKLNGDMLRTRTSGQDDYFHFENGKLTGFLGLYGFGSSYELCGMVHPHYRNRGIFKSLYNKALASLKDREITKLLLNAPGSSASGKAFIEAQPAGYSFSEYQMKWQPRELNRDETDIELIEVTKDDLPLIIELDFLCFNVAREDSLEFMKTVKQAEDSSSFMIVNKGEKVGKIHIQRESGRSYIFGFAVHPSHQGKGIGRSVLEKSVVLENETGRDIFLEVAAKNENALKLYESAGFVTYQVQNYYDFERL